MNRLYIRDPDKLAEAEAEFTAERYRTYEALQLSPEGFTFEPLQHLHHHLFQYLHEWAGKPRVVDISKWATRFCTCSRIQPEAKKLLATAPVLSMILILEHDQGSANKL